MKLKIIPLQLKNKIQSNRITPKQRAAVFMLVFVMVGFGTSLFIRAETTHFTMNGTKIVDPDGNEFIPSGANFNGGNWVWGSLATGKADYIKNTWKWNTVRLNYCLTSCDPPWQWNTDEAQLDAMITELTSKKIVAMIEMHEGATGVYPGDKADAIDAWWRAKAIKYKDNPYVWFNILNEPGNMNIPNNLQQWQDVHARYIRAIRQEGARNMIVVDGTHWGQDLGYWDSSNATTVSPNNSAILQRGPALLQIDPNIVFSIHTYDQWAVSQDIDINTARLFNYIDQVKAKNMGLMIGEVGVFGDKPENQTANGYGVATRIVRGAYRAALEKNTGVLWWHAQPGDGHSLTIPGAFDKLDSTTSPTNLTWGGQLAWDTAQTLAARAPQVVSTAPTPTPSPTPIPEPTPTPAATTSYNDNSFEYSAGWATSTGSAKFQSDDHYTSTVNATYSYTFSGAELKLFASRASHHGFMAVSIDGATETLVDLYSAVRADQQVVYTSPALATGVHTVKVRATGTKNSQSTGTVINADRLDVAAQASAPAPSTTPSVAIVGVSNAQTVNGGVRIEATTANAGTVYQVEFQMDGVAQYVVEKSAPYCLSAADTNGVCNVFDTTKLPNGSHTLIAKLTSSVGGASTSVTFNVNNSGGSIAPTDTAKTGLSGAYFNNTSLGGSPVMSRIDSAINFDWGSQKPAYTINKDYFSARWTGKVFIPKTERYTFGTWSDDGVRLWVNGQLVINNWTKHPATYNSGSLNLDGNTYYDIKMEFYEATGKAIAKLYWSSPSLPQQVVPKDHLFQP